MLLLFMLSIITTDPLFLWINLGLTFIVPLITLTRKDKNNPYWRYKKPVNRISIFLILLCFYAFARLFFMFYYNFFSDYLISSGLTRGYISPSLLLAEIGYWFLVFKGNLFSQEPIVYRQLTLFIFETIFVAMFIGVFAPFIVLVAHNFH